MPHFYQNRVGSSSSSNSQRSAAVNPNDMDLSNVNHDDVIKAPTFHEEEPSSSSSSSSSQSDMMREFNRMKSELKKFQTEAAISALGSSSSSSSRVQVSKEEYDYCFKNRLCLKCKKANHMAKDCRSKYQALNLNQ
jgi:hypothetical protein